jgi:hypothetical protein
VAADGIAIVAKLVVAHATAGLCDCGSRHGSMRGRHKPPPDCSRGNSQRGKDLSRPRDSEPFEKGPSARKRCARNGGNTPREGLFPFLFPLPKGLSGWSNHGGYMEELSATIRATNGWWPPIAALDISPPA